MAPVCGRRPSAAEAPLGGGAEGGQCSCGPASAGLVGSHMHGTPPPLTRCRSSSHASSRHRARRVRLSVLSAGDDCAREPRAGRDRRAPRRARGAGRRADRASTPRRASRRTRRARRPSCRRISASGWRPRRDRRHLGAAPDDVAGTRQCRAAAVGFDGRPQLAARFAGAGGGRSLLLNGHIDAVRPSRRAAGRAIPSRRRCATAALRPRRLRHEGRRGGDGRSPPRCSPSCGVPLAGDLIVCTVTDEESSGVGGARGVRHGVRPTPASSRSRPASTSGSPAAAASTPRSACPGRAGHAEMRHRTGATAARSTRSRRALRCWTPSRACASDWRGRRSCRHTALAPPDDRADADGGRRLAGDLPRRGATHLRRARTCPARPTPSGWGRSSRPEFEAPSAGRVRGSDPWLAEHPPTFPWSTTCRPCRRVPDDAPIVQRRAGAADAVGRPAAPSGALDSWYDGALLALAAARPSLLYGPRRIDVAHTIDEHVPVDDLVQTARRRWRWPASRLATSDGIR